MADGVPFPILILAAGASSRMGGVDKLMEPVRGQSLLADRVAMARSCTDQVLVTLPPAPHPRHSVVTGAARVEVSDPGQGLSASLKAGIAALPMGAPRVMVVLADMPDLEAHDLRAVATAARGHATRGATEDGKPGHPIVFDRALFPALLAATGDTGGQHALRAAGEVTLVRLPGNRARLDLDTPAAWAAWRARTS